MDRRGHLRRERPVRRGSHHGQVGRRDRGEPSAQPVDAGERRLDRIEVHQSAPRGKDQRGLELFEPGGIPEQEQVDTGRDRRQQVDDLVGPLRERVHVERVRDRQAIEPEVVAEEGLQHGGRERRREIVATRQSRHRHMARHHERCAGGDGRAERCELHGRETVAIMGDGRQLVMRVAIDIADAREVLRGGRHAGRGQAAHGRHAEACHGLRRRPERPDAEGRVCRVGREIEHGRVAHVHAHRAKLQARGVSHPRGQSLVTGRTQRHRTRERRHALPECVELPALLVRGDEQRPTGRLLQ